MESVSDSPLLRKSKSFALAAVRLVDSLPRRRVADVIGHQLLRSATSVGANYRAACRARTVAEFCAKMGIVEEESDESRYWLELIAESALARPDIVSELIALADEITAMTVASIRTAKAGAGAKKNIRGGER